MVYQNENSKMSRTSVLTYSRTSTKRQGEKGVSMEDQRQEIEAFNAENGHKSFGDYADVGSGVGEEEGSKREQYKIVRRLSLKNDWPIVVTVPSRFTRTLSQYDDYIAKGGRLICVKPGIKATEDEIRAFLMVEIAQLEQRQRTAMIGQQRAREQGRLPGNPDLAHAREKSIESRHENMLVSFAEFERQLELARANGAKTLREIVAAFRKAGFKTNRNKPWKDANVRRVMDAIAKMKAAGGIPNPAAPVMGANDNVERSGTAAASMWNTPNVGVDAEGSFALSPAELYEFRSILERKAVPAEKFAALMRTASNPNLTQGKQAILKSWLAKKRLEASRAA